MNAMMWQTPLGWVRVEAGEAGIRRVEFHSRQERLGERAGETTDECPAAAMSLLREARRQIDAYLAGAATTFEMPLDLSGLSPFAQRVLQVLQTVPHGATVTYQELARLAGSPGAARAVGGVMAANPLPIIIPCHRVVTASGGLGGYSGGEGVASKRWLLEHEGALAASGSAAAPR